MEVRPLPAGGPAMGEPILVLQPVLGHVIHRVIWRWPLWGSPVWVYTKGDAIPHRDRRLAGDRVLGRVAWVRREGHPAVPGRKRRWRSWLLSVAGMVRQRLLGRRSSRGSAQPAAEEETETRNATGIGGG